MLDTYGELKATVLDYINYNDNSLIDKVPTFISLANNELNRILRTPAQENVIYHTVTATDEVKWPVPNDLIELRRIYYSDTYETVDRVDIGALPYEKYQNFSDVSNDDRPVSFARSQDWWHLSRLAVPNTQITVVYYKQIEDMVDDNDTSVWLQQAASALLYRAIGEGHRFLENIEAAEYWFSKAAEEAQYVQQHADRDENAGSVILAANNAWF